MEPLQSSAITESNEMAGIIVGDKLMNIYKLWILEDEIFRF